MKVIIIFPSPHSLFPSNNEILHYVSVIFITWNIANKHIKFNLFVIKLISISLLFSFSLLVRDEESFLPLRVEKLFLFRHVYENS